ncbi:Putative acyl-CoA synthetase YngI [Geodia barretti]|uniref:Medium-chain acyl-CoA ligase ACSF2, mitochondrial n=1 Tax=Geodia barretti TaxID=519541 RepID=A0AA35X6B3_GEOBA|nr:Putative acyl-CoA synthetase YngI [Geodia barretti]
MLDRQVERFSDREALVHNETGARYTYTEFRNEVERVARGLMALGVQRGHHVGIWATNYTEWVLTQFATAKIGSVMVNVNPAYRTHELAYLLEQSEANALILIGRFRNSDYAAMLNEVVPDLKDSNPGELSNSRFPYLRDVVAGAPTPAGMWSWAEMVGRHTEVSPEQLAARQAECQPDDPVNIQYTSGTTGNPKGAMLTHHNLVSNAVFVGDCIELTEHDRLCIPVPFYHCFGCVMGNLGCITHGSAIIIPAEHFDPLKTLQALDRERCTALYGVPTMFIAQLDHPQFDSFDVSSLRTGIMAGSPCPIEVMRQVIDRMGAHQMTIAYGQTAATLHTAHHTPDPSPNYRAHSERSSAGVLTARQVLPGVEAEGSD